MLKNAHPEIWQRWSARLQRWRLSEFTATLLEATEPLHLVGAQLVYMGQPVLRGLVADEALEALADVLEDDEQRSAFLASLREANA